MITKNGKAIDSRHQEHQVHTNECNLNKTPDFSTCHRLEVPRISGTLRDDHLYDTQTTV